MGDGSKLTSSAAQGISSGENCWISAGPPIGSNSTVIKCSRSPCSAALISEIEHLNWCSVVMPPNSGDDVWPSPITMVLGGAQLGDSASLMSESTNFAGPQLGNTVWSLDTSRSGRSHESMQNLQGNLHEVLCRRAMTKKEMLRHPSLELNGNLRALQGKENKNFCELSNLPYSTHGLADDRRLGSCNSTLSDLTGSWSLPAADVSTSSISVNSLADLHMSYERPTDGDAPEGFEPHTYNGEAFPDVLDISSPRSTSADNNYYYHSGPAIIAGASSTSSTTNIILSSGFSRHLPSTAPQLRSTDLSCPFGVSRLRNVSSFASHRVSVLQAYNSKSHADEAQDSRTRNAPKDYINTESSATGFKRPRLQTTPPPLPTSKVRKEKLGDRITTLQQLVSPFGKTDTASVLLEAIGYIKFLQEQVQVLSMPYMNGGRNSAQGPQHQILSWGLADNKDSQEPKQDLRSRGLCLVPFSSTFNVEDDISAAVYWTPFLNRCNDG